MQSLITPAIHCLDREQDPELPGDAGQSVACDDSGTMLLVTGCEPIQKPEILIVGCGGMGNSVINRLFHRDSLVRGQWLSITINGHFSIRMQQSRFF